MEKTKNVFFFLRVFILIMLLIEISHFSLEVAFFNTNIKEALNMLALDTGAVILYEPSISGSVTLQIQEDNIEKVLDLILLPYSYYWTKLDNIYFVGNMNVGSTAFTNVARVYQIPLKYNSSNTILDVIPKVFQDYVMKPIDNSSIIIYAPPPVAARIASFISHIDVPNSSNEIYVRVVDVSENFLKSHMPEISLSSLSIYAPRLLQIPLLNTHLNILLNINESTDELEIIYEGRVKALSGYQSKISTSKAYTIQKYVDGKFTTVQNQAIIELTLTPRFLYKSCLIDLSLKIDGIPIANELNIETKGATLQSTLNVEYNKMYHIGAFSYDKFVQKEGGIPFLKDLPFIGWLFKNFYTESEKRYVIFILSVGSIEELTIQEGEGK
ncbi:hypothetical protein [Fervidobacterium sp.]